MIPMPIKPSVVLTSNGYTISEDAEYIGWLKPSHPKTCVRRLWQQYQEQGYLWLKGLLDPKQIKDFRQKFFERCVPTGLIQEGTLLEQGIFSGQQISNHLMNRIRQSAILSKEYQALAESPRILSFLNDFLGGSVCSLQRKLIRCKVPNAGDDTGAHYDFTYLRCGSDEVVTCWIPLGDTPTEMGGLIYLENSTSLGKLIERKFDSRLSNLPTKQQQEIRSKGMGRIGWLSKEFNTFSNTLCNRWLIAGYDAGDVVLHNPYIIHASSSNVDPLSRVRLSTDIRYRLVSSRTDDRWEKMWNPNDGL